ncbi:MAG: trp operon repressor [Spirochaetales bacterium]|nr:trp operon repressor [Spirochaetales bacterium]
MYDDVDPTPLKELSLALAATDDPALIHAFLESLFTGNEVDDISSRWTLVRLIDRGMSQRAISRELGLSLCKITRGSRELKKEASPFASMIRQFEKGRTVQGEDRLENSSQDDSTSAD